MTSKATLQPDPAPILACTISRDVQNFEILIDDMERNWAKPGATSALRMPWSSWNSPTAAELQFIAIAVDSDDESDCRRSAT
jgi:pilus assembly protein CpaE